jgi:hypothetical protein
MDQALEPPSESITETAIEKAMKVEENQKELMLKQSETILGNNIHLKVDNLSRQTLWNSFSLPKHISPSNS